MSWYKDLSLGKKIIFPLILVSLFTGFLTFEYFKNLYKETETKALVSKARAVVLSAESSREYTAQQIKMGVFAKENLSKESVLYTVPIFSAMQTAKKKASELGFQLKVPKFSPRNPENEPDAYETNVLKLFEKADSSEFWEIDEATNKVRYFRPVKLTEECMRCHGDPSTSVALWGNMDGRDITGGKMEGWKVGEVHGAFEVMMSMAPVDAAVQNESLIIAAISALGIGLILMIGFWVVRKTIAPVQELEKAANRVASGDTDVNLQSDTNDELGSLTRSFTVMVNNIKTARAELLDEKAGIQQKVDDAVRTIESEKQYLSRSVDTMIQNMNKFADGDLTVKLVPEKDDEIGRLFTGFNRAIVNFKDMVHRLGEAVSATSSASAQISSSTEEMAAGASEQTSRTDDIARAVDEMVKTIISNTRSVSSASNMAKNAGDKAKEGGSVVEKTIAGMNKVSEVVRHSADTIEELGKSSDQIGAIIQVIEEIADQTNLLALNAAIEAARAGEQGRGFAVVADEVRKLAERTTKATKEIAVMIKQIQQNTSGAVKSIQDGTKEVEAGRDLAVKAGTVLKEIIQEADRVVDVVNQVAAASEQQSSSAEQIGKNVESITNVTRENAIGTQQIAQAAEDLNQLTERLQMMINQFKVNYSDDQKLMAKAQNDKIRLKLN